MIVPSDMAGLAALLDFAAIFAVTVVALIGYVTHAISPKPRDYLLPNRKVDA